MACPLYGTGPAIAEELTAPAARVENQRNLDNGSMTIRPIRRIKSSR
ncbi:hypothetical protein [Lawsonella sp.]|nr:hypothetical protein [Lawsonella sp.]